MKKILSLISLLLACLMAAGTFAGCAVVNAGADDLTYVTLRINPEIELVADKDGTVVAVGALNEDGEILLTDMDPVGETLEDAAEAFVDTAAALGYLDVDGEDVTVYVDADAGKKTDKVKKSLSEKLDKYFENKGVKGKVSAETWETYAEAAADWDVTPGHARMILRVLELNPELDADDVLAMTVKEMKSLIRDAAGDGLTLKARKEVSEQMNKRKDDTALSAVAQEIQDLKAALGDKTLTREERQELKDAIAAKKQEKKHIAEALRAEAKALREAMREEAAAERTGKEQIKDQKKQDNTEKIKAHEEKVRTEKEKKPTAGKK